VRAERVPSRPTLFVPEPALTMMSTYSTGGHLCTPTPTPRRRHDAELKPQVLAACRPASRQPYGPEVAGRQDSANQENGGRKEKKTAAGAAVLSLGMSTQDGSITLYRFRAIRLSCGDLLVLDPPVPDQPRPLNPVPELY